MEPEYWEKQARCRNPIGTICRDCANAIARADHARKRAARRARRPDLTYMRFLTVPGEPAWSYRDIKGWHLRDMIKDGFFPAGTKVMDHKSRQFIVRENGHGFEMEPLTGDRRHPYSAPNVRIGG